MKILIAEDEEDMLKIISLYLKRAGYNVSQATNGKKALDMLNKEHYDLLICDWMMPEMDGIELCKEVRSYLNPIKIIMLTAKANVFDEIMGLECGADDYIKKPFEPELLLLRIKKMFQLEREIQCGDVLMNIQKNAVYVKGEEVSLTKKEWSLLHVLMINKGITIERNRIIELVWGVDYSGDERTLDTHIKRLRNKIGDAYIITYIGVGYRMDELNE